MALDYTVSKLIGTAPGTWRTSKSIGGFITETVLDAESVKGMPEGWARHVIFLKPRTFMNFSGGPVVRAIRELGVAPSDIIVLHDDLQRKLAAVSVKTAGSASGHNGLKSMIASLKSDDFQRIRIGIDRPASKDPGDVGDYVLQRFRDAEIEKLKSDGYPTSHKALLQLIKASKGMAS
ncbi:hypothetical protein PhCBS80983_g00592 [Powellomyces hirtus]|uniref:peptidyl-tRNA hydrolase n=1 Tax=Powellomyces hirtus TaxID=109895 RepID=A0A507EFV0_9FUNG|nr:hypothetical protein PhCBS80983_g00592 [Powellomyces hirtus]